MRISLLLGVALFTACASTAPTAPPAAQAAVGIAERFVARHGFTSSGHPKDLPIESVSLHDVRSRPEWLLEERRGAVEKRAACVRTLSGNKHSVLFHSNKEPGSYLFVLVTGQERPYVLNQLVAISPNCVPVTKTAP